MIDPKSLRIGNYFRWSEFASMGKGIDRIESGQQIDNYANFKEGIPLSEQELIRLGFQFTVASSWSTATEVKYKCWTNGRLTFNEIQDTWWFHGRVLDKQLQFVHQLQNFHYVMTGEELNYKP